MSLDLTEHPLSSEIIAAGGMLTVKRDQVRLPNGNISQREYVEHPGAVVVVPFASKGTTTTAPGCSTYSRWLILPFGNRT